MYLAVGQSLLFSEGVGLAGVPVDREPRADERLMRLQRAGELILLEQRVVVGDSFLCKLRDGIVRRLVSRILRWIRDLAPEITRDHRQSAAGEIAQAIREV